MLQTTRRDALIGGVATLAGWTPARLWAAAAAGDTPAIAAATRALLDIVCDLVVPATDTPGALAVRVPDFVVLGLRHGLSGEHRPAGSATIALPGAPARPRGDLDVLDRIAAVLERRAGGDFAALAAARQLAILEAVDCAAYAAGEAPGDWRMLKSLILTGYYTSEAGASAELQYQLVPGRWDTDLLLRPDGRSWSSDWTAASFG